MGQAAALLDPIVARIREEGFRADKLHADDTPVPMLDPGRGKTATARLWTYVVDDRASGAVGPALVWYRFMPDRSGIHPQAELKLFSGLLQADGYAGYDKLYESGRVKEIACWAHFRRKIFENHAASPTPLTTDLLERIAKLYACEADVRGQPPDVRRLYRQQHSKPLIDGLRTAIDDALRRLSPKSAMARALAYGRKNWLFAGSVAGGERAAAIYSVIETCKLNGAEPQAYIADVIEKIASDWPASRWDKLMPWNWTAASSSLCMAA